MMDEFNEKQKLIKEINELLLMKTKDLTLQ